MVRAPGRKTWFLAAAVLCGLALFVWGIMWDPEKRLVEQAVRAYVGDLRTRALESASKRIFPDDLLELKNAALFKAGVQETFRREALEFFQAADLDEVRKAPREKFFEFLLVRTYREHRPLFEDLARGKVVGVRVRRKQDTAQAWAFVDITKSEGKRRLTVRATLIKRDGVWWIRI